MLSLFLAGLLGSVNHCTGMCGPFVLAQLEAPKHKEHHKPQTLFNRIKGTALLPYHLGRLTTYVFLGVISASLSQFIVGSPMQRGVAFILLTLAGLLFLSRAVPSIKAMCTTLFKRPSRDDALVPKTSMYGKFIGRAARPFFMGRGAGRQYLLGVLLGFMPCALVIAAIMAVAATGSPITAAFGMVAFGVATIPALIMVGVGGHFAISYWPHGMKQISTGIMAINGVGLMVLAGGMVI